MSDPTDENIARTEQKWIKKHQGKRKYGRPIVLPAEHKLEEETDSQSVESPSYRERIELGDTEE